MTSRPDSSRPNYYLAVQGPLAYDLPENFLSVGVGERAKEAGVLSDDSDEPNIHEKNALYCELTAYYWVWKHRMKSPGVTGFGHYRRVFGKKSLWGLMSKTPLVNDATNLLQVSDFIVPLPFTLRDSILSAYERVHCDQLLRIASNLIDQDFSLNLGAAEFFASSNQLYPFNMGIAQNHQWEKYFGWLFGVLETVEESCSHSGMVLKPRALGFLAERLFTLWINQPTLRKVECPVLELDKSGWWNLRRAAHLNLKKLRF
jgi:hypothetical protein